MTEGDIITVEASIYPENTAYGTISWRSSDDSIVSVYMLSVAHSARIVANSPGTAQITVLLSNGTARSITVTVEQAELPSTPPGDTGGTDDFVIYSVEDMFAKKYFFADRTTGDYMNDAIYERQNAIETSLGVDLVYKAAEGVGETQAFQQYATEVMNSIKAGDAKYQLVLSHVYYAIPDLIMGGYLKDFNDFENIDLTASYWNKSIMDEVAYKDSYYLGYSDFNLAQTYVVAFNKSLYNENAEKFEGSTLYDYVRGGNWTLTKMSEAAALVYEDKGNVEQNVYGLTGELWTPFVGFIQSSGESLVTRSVSGKYQISWIDDKTIKSNINNMINTIRDIDSMEETHFWRHEAFQPSRKTVELTTGRAFMQLISTNELPNLKNSTVTYGVLPYPMYEESQYKTVGYRSLNWGGYLCVPSNNIDNADIVGSVLEGLALYSEDVTKAYYDKLLGFKVSDSSDDAEMLDIIWDSICVDFGVTYEMIDDKGNLDAIVYTVPRCVMENMQFNSWHSRYGGAANNAINNKLNK